ncbi:translation initiation factor IF-3 [Naviculisporaceae sp. PSN 640]
MQNSKCLFNSAIALRRVFLSGALASDAVAIQQPASRQLSRQSYSAQQRPRGIDVSRSFSAQPVLFRIARNSGKKAEQELQTTKNKAPRDQEIRAPFVHLITSNGISNAMRTSDILRDLDRTRESLLVVSMPSRDDPENYDRRRPEWPICKIIDTEKERKEEYAKKKELRKKSVMSKELEINWGIAMNDLEMTKLKQLKKFLAKGMQVQISLVAKGKSKKSGKKNVASDDEAKEILKAIKAAVAEIPGSTEAKIEGNMGHSMTIVYHGPANGYTPPQPSEGAAAAPSLVAAGTAS